MATTPTFGVVTTAQGRGLIQSIGFANTADRADARDEAGNIIRRHYYGGGKTITLSALLTTEIELPSIGATIHVASCEEAAFNGTYYVDSTAVAETNTAYQTVNFVASRAHAVDVEVTFTGSAPSPSP